MNNILKGFGILALYKVQGVISSFLAVLAIVSLYLNDNEPSASAIATVSILAIILVQIIFVIILGVIYRKQIKRVIKNIDIDKFIKYESNILKYYVFIILNAIIISIITTLFFKEFSGEVSVNQETLEMLLANGSFIGFFIITVITGPIIEEYVFRYAIISKMLKNQKMWLQILISSLIFIMAHLGFNSASSLKELIYLMLLYSNTAPIFAYAYIKGGYKMSLGVHIFYNFIAVIMLSLI